MQMQSHVSLDMIVLLFLGEMVEIQESTDSGRRDSHRGSPSIK